MIHLAPVEPFAFSLTPARAKAIKDAALGKLRPSIWRSGMSFACAIIQVVIWRAHSMRHGQPANLRWNEIDGVQDLDGTVVIRRRRGGIIAIPKADVDAPALWSLLEERLISKRGLIRSPAIRSVIPNTAC